jgi:multisubunit Na+/H+ antiporter MnhC subunit
MLPVTRRSWLVGWGWFGVWVLVGGLSVLGLVSFVIVFALVVIPLGALGIWMVTRPSSRDSAFGLLTGAGLPLFLVAYVNREGPGTTCWHTATASGCDEHIDPLPWLLVGLVLVVGGIVGHVLVMRAVNRDVHSI